MFPENQKKSLYIILGLIVLIGVFFFSGVWRKKSEQADQNTESFSKVNIEHIESGKLAPELPIDLPLEVGALAQRSEIIKSKDGSEIQHVYGYVSRKTVSDNLAIYKKYLADTGWEVKTSNMSNDLAFLIAEKEGRAGFFQINISKNSITGDVMVELNIILREKNDR